MNRDELTHEVAQALLDNKRLTIAGWRRIVVSASFTKGSSHLAALVFLDAGGYRSILAKSPALESALTRLRDEMARTDSRPPWAACLVRLRRHGEDVEIDMDFDHDDPDRWAVGPDNLAERIAEFDADD